MFGSDLQRNRSPFCMAWALLAWLPLGSCSLRYRLAFCLIDEEAGVCWGKRGSEGGGDEFLTPNERELTTPHENDSNTYNTFKSKM